MLMWLVVVVLLSLLAFVWIKLEHQFNLIKFGIVVFIVLLLIGSMVVMFTSGEVDFTTPSGMIHGVYLYIGWLGEFARSAWNIGTETTGKVISAMNVSESDFVSKGR